MQPTLDNWYDYPQYYDLSFGDETITEANFFAAAFAKYCSFPVRRVFEPGCGSGRLVVEMAERGFGVSAFDNNDRSLEFLRRRLERRGLVANIKNDDLVQFDLGDTPYDAAFCTFDTFRHLLAEVPAQSHLENVAQHLRPGGIYILGLHLFPDDVSDECVERWSARSRDTKVAVTLEVIGVNELNRLEKIAVTMRVVSFQQLHRIRTEFWLRRYDVQQIENLLERVTDFELVDVYDFTYDIDEPLELNNEIADTVFILRKKS